MVCEQRCMERSDRGQSARANHQPVQRASEQRASTSSAHASYVRTVQPTIGYWHVPSL